MFPPVAASYQTMLEPDGTVALAVRVCDEPVSHTVTLAGAVGADGVAGCALNTTLPDAGEIHPTAFVTVKLYVVPAVNPEIVVEAVLPVIFPGLMVQFPDGKPFKTTLPVATVQVGCVRVPTVGAVGIALILITALPVIVAVQDVPVLVAITV